MNILKKSLAPVSDEAWEELESQAKMVLKSFLTARHFVDVEGPKGWDYGAVTLGRLDTPKNQKGNEVPYGVHRVLPLIETRIPFKLNIWELDNIERGAQDVDFEPLENAAKKIAAFEEKAIYYGFEAAHITGLKKSSEFEVLSCPQNAEELVCNVPLGISRLKESAIEGPYALIVDPEKWRHITSYVNGYPLKRQVEDLLGGRIIFCPHIEEMFLVSERGGDYQLTLGQDLSIGYDQHDTKEVQLYFTESFTFRVLEPRAVVVFE